MRQLYIDFETTVDIVVRGVHFEAAIKSKTNKSQIYYSNTMCNVIDFWLATLPMALLICE